MFFTYSCSMRTRVQFKGKHSTEKCICYEFFCGRKGVSQNKLQIFEKEILKN